MNGLAVYVTRAGAEAERVLFVRALLDSLAAARDKNVATFSFLRSNSPGRSSAWRRWRDIFGTKRWPARPQAALRTIGGREAVGVFMRALDSAPPSVRLPVVEALSARYATVNRSGSSSPSPKAATRDSAARPGSLWRISATRRSAHTRPDEDRRHFPGKGRAPGPLSSLRRAGSWSPEGRRRGVGRGPGGPGYHGGPSEGRWLRKRSPSSCQSLESPPFPIFCESQQSPVPAVREAALDLATPIGGRAATAQSIALAEASAPDIRAAIIAMLGRRGDVDALPFVVKACGARIDRPPGRHSRRGRRAARTLYRIVAGSSARKTRLRSRR